MNLVDAFQVVVNSINEDREVVRLGLELQYMYGHFLEINTKLKVKELNKDIKYPLLALRLDTPENIAGGYTEYININLVLLQYTDRKYDAKKRQENIFKPCLYPLYEALMKHIESVGLFTWNKPLNSDTLIPPHTKTDRYYWGTLAEYQNIKFIFDDPLDAIEISNLSLKIRQTC